MMMSQHFARENSLELLQVSPQAFELYAISISVDESSRIQERCLAGDYMVLAPSTGSCRKDEDQSLCSELPYRPVKESVIFGVIAGAKVSHGHVLRVVGPNSTQAALFE